MAWYGSHPPSLTCDPPKQLDLWAGGVRVIAIRAQLRGNPSQTLCRKLPMLRLPCRPIRRGSMCVHSWWQIIYSSAGRTTEEMKQALDRHQATHAC